MNIILKNSWIKLYFEIEQDKSDQCENGYWKNMFANQINLKFCFFWLVGIVILQWIEYTEWHYKHTGKWWKKPEHNP